MNKDEKKAQKRAAKRATRPKGKRSQEARLARMEKEMRQLRKDNQVLVDAVSSLRKDYLGSMTSIASEDRRTKASIAALFQNDRGLGNANDGLADRFFGFLDFLRDNDERYAELLTDENLVKYAQAYRDKRIAEEEAKKKAEEEAKAAEEARKAEEAKQDALKEEMEAPPADQPEEVPDIPEGATEFGG